MLAAKARRDHLDATSGALAADSQFTPVAATVHLPGGQLRLDIALRAVQDAG